MPFARRQTLKMPKALRSSFDQALRPLPSVVKGVQASPKTLRGSWDQAIRPLPSVVKGVQACRLPGLKPLKCLKPSAAASTRHSGHSPLFLRRTWRLRPASQRCSLCSRQRSGFLFRFLFFACPFVRNVPMFLLASLSRRRVTRDRDSLTPTFKRAHPPHRPYTLYC